MENNALSQIADGAMMKISMYYDTVTLHGIARCDLVKGGGGILKLRARFAHGVKAVLDFEHYGKYWEAERL